MIFFFRLSIFLAICSTPTMSAPYRLSKIVKLLGNWTAYLEMSKLVTFSLQKFEDVPCHTIIWDAEMSSVVDYLDLCTEEDCVPKYSVQFDGYFSDTFTSALKASYRAQCGAYIILLRNAFELIELLHYGDDLRTIDTRARFLIWYGEADKLFDNDDIWKKVPSVVFFHANLKRRTTRNKRQSFKIMTMKWPVMPNVTETTRVIDFWRNGKLAKNDNAWYGDKTANLRNLTLRVVAVEHPPSVVKYNLLDGQVEYGGTEFEVLKELALIMNFQFEIIDADPETKWGGMNTTDVNSTTAEFYGAIAKLVDGDVDMGIGAFLVLKHYLDYLDMSIPLDVVCTSFLVPVPLPRPRYLAMILPFQFALWTLVIVICFFVAPVGFYLMGKFPMHAEEHKMFLTRWHCLFTSVSIISQVSLHLWPKFWPIRMVILWYWILCLLITLGYRCAMVSFLSIPLFEKTIDNTKDLAASKLRIGGWNEELRNLFTNQQASEDDKTKAYLSSIYETLEDYDTGLNLVSERKMAMYENVRYLKFIAKTRNLTRVGTQTMRVMKQCVLPVHIGFAYEKNSAITPTINSHVRRFQESGLMKKWSQRLISKTKQHDREQTNDLEETAEEEEEKDEGEDPTANKKERKQRVLSIKDLQGAIYLITLGISLSLLAFLGEILCKKYCVNVDVKGATEIVQKLVETTKKVRHEQELKSILREMGFIPKRRSVAKAKMKKGMLMLRNCGKEEKFTYLE